MGNGTRRLAFLTLALAANTWAISFFPGAEGFGGSFTGVAPANGWFSNATVYHVTTTADTLAGDGKPAVGTLRGAFYNAARSQQNANVIVVFDIGGTFQLTQGSLDIKTVNNIYIAGQTAPSPVTVYNDTTQITHSNNTQNSNLILRYMTFRRGVATAGNNDSLTFAGGANDGSGSIATNMIVDHVSTSWATDENLSVANNNTNITVQYSINSDSLRSDHAYGSLIRPRTNASVTYAHNLYANNLSRNPRPGTYNGNQLTLDFRNNVVYNWKDRAGYSGGSSEADTENVNLNYAGNYFIAGPSTPLGTKSTTAFTKDIGGAPLNLKVYQSGNVMDSNHDAIRDGTDTGWGMFIQSNGVTTSAFPAADQVGSAFAAGTFLPQVGSDAYNSMLASVGNFWWARDSIDSRIISNVQNNTEGSGGVAALVPIASELNTVLTAPTVTRPANWDTDNDGMPNAWEISRGLNPNLASDGTLDFDTDGYVNVVEYLNEVGAFPAPTALVFNGTVNSRFAISDNWSAGWQPSRFDTAKINTGTAIIDAIGQSAGTILVGTDTGSSGRLQVNSGWAEVYNALRVGSTGGSTGTLALNGGTLRSAKLVRVNDTGVLQFNGGTLDLTSGVAIFDYASISPAGVIRSAIVAGQTGAGLTSSTAALDARMAVGYVEADSLTLAGNLFYGEAVDATTVLAAYTYRGDANLDRKVDSLDLNALIAGYGNAGVWWQGDFNYDGKVNTLDFNLLAGNFGLILASATPGSNLGVVVPEPSAIALVGASMLLGNRRRTK